MALTLRLIFAMLRGIAVRLDKMVMSRALQQWKNDMERWLDMKACVCPECSGAICLVSHIMSYVMPT